MVMSHPRDETAGCQLEAAATPLLLLWRWIVVSGACRCVQCVITTGAFLLSLLMVVAYGCSWLTCSRCGIGYTVLVSCHISAERAGRGLNSGGGLLCWYLCLFSDTTDKALLPNCFSAVCVRKSLAPKAYSSTGHTSCLCAVDLTSYVAVGIFLRMKPSVALASVTMFDSLFFQVGSESKWPLGI